MRSMEQLRDVMFYLETAENQPPARWDPAGNPGGTDQHCHGQPPAPHLQQGSCLRKGRSKRGKWSSEVHFPGLFSWHSRLLGLSANYECGPWISISQDQATVVRIFHLLVCGVTTVEGWRPGELRKQAVFSKVAAFLNHDSSLTSDILMTILPSYLIDAPTLLCIFPVFVWVGIWLSVLGSV